MPNEFNKIGLYDHNADSYRKVRNAFNSGEKVVGIVHATGTGKTFNALQLALDNKEKKILYVVPSNGIIEHIKEIINKNPNLDYNRDFPNLEFITYQKISSMQDEELKGLDIDLLILDEFHHIGAPIWGKKVNTIINTHPDMNVFGMTAYTVRNRGSLYERDMANPETEELFSNKIVSKYDLADAWLDGVLPLPNYKTSRIKLLELETELEIKAKSMNASNPDYLKNMALLNDIKKLIHNAPKIKDVVKKNTKPNGKYIYFCPPGAFDEKNDIETIKKEAMEWFREIASEQDIVFYTTTSEMGVEGKKNRDAFYNDQTLDGEDANGKLRVMFAINQYNEGIHAPNIDGVIMGRGTKSDIVFFEQMGRALSVRGDTKEKFDEYNNYSIEQLIKLCEEKDIKIKENTQKEIIIEKLIAPVIIDLTDNIDMIKNLENNLKERFKLYREKGIGNTIFRDLNDIAFDIDVQNEDIYKTLIELRKRINPTSEEKIEQYFKIVNEEGQLPKYNDERTFSDGTGIRQFWHSNKETLNETIQQEKYKTKYPIAYEVITRAYQEYKFDKNNPNWKIEEYFEIVNEEGRLPKQSDEREFSDGVNLGAFWYSNREKLNTIIQQEEYKVKYSIAYEAITRVYQEYLSSKGKSMSFEEKIEEYFEIVNEEGQLPKKRDERTFSDGTGIGEFWINNREKLNTIIQQEEYKTKYPIAYEVITRVYLGYLNSKEKSISFDEKIEEYFKIVNEEGQLPKYDDQRTFSDGTGIRQFWQHNNNKEKLNETIQQEEYKTKYPIAHEVITKAYQEYKGKQILKQRDLAKELCLINNINIELNSDVIEHLLYEELFAKISLLKELNIALVNSDGILHEIFSMSAMNMKVKFGYDMEELLNKYPIKSKGKGK